MSKQKKSTIKERLATARKLAQEGRYEAARYVLGQVEHPKAKTMLQALEDYDDKNKTVPMFSSFTVFMTIGTIIAIVGFIAIILLMIVLDRVQETRYEDSNLSFYDESTGNIVISEEESLYLNVVDYCFQITGYGGDLCLDWTDTLLIDYRKAVNTCFAPYLEKNMLDAADYLEITLCLKDADVPPPL